MSSNDRYPAVLIVEDDPVQQLFMRILCEKLGFEVDLVANGSDALRAIENCIGCYDAILMDWKMPTMDGLAATRAIRELESASGVHTPIIAVTAKSLKGDREHCLEAGMDDYLSKPFKADVFRSTLLHWTYNASGQNLKFLHGQIGKTPSGDQF